MKNNEIGKIAVAQAGHPRSRFNLAHDVNTTAGFGDLQPLMCQFMVPNSKGTLDVESLVRAAPMVRPTFGRLDAKMWSMFVPLDEVFPNYDAMMARTRIGRSGSNGPVEFTPQQLPVTTPKKLAALILMGAECSCWISQSRTGMEPQTLEAVNEWIMYTEEHSSTLAGNVRDYVNTLWTEETLPNFDYSGVCLNFGSLFGTDFGGTGAFECKIPAGTGPNSYPNISLDLADFVLIRNMAPAGEFDTHPRALAFAFRLSSYGCRMYKLLTGLGLPVSLEDDTTQVSLLPLLAWYRGYFELFGLSLFENFEESACSKLIQYITNNNAPHYELPSSGWTDTNSVLWQFLRELGSCYVTEDVDYVSQHIATAGTGSFGTGSQLLQQMTAFANGGRFIDTSLNPNLFSWATGTEQTSAGLHYNGVDHGALDEQILKIFFRWTNRQTIDGQDIEKNLRSLGLGHYVDEIKVDFIGYWSRPLNISDITATADTSQVVDGKQNGAPLGDFAGKSVTYDKSDNVVWETRKAGYWITYGAIVPRSGYCQAYDSTTTAVKPFDIYTPELDSRGYEATTKKELFGYGQIASRSSDVGNYDAVFGFRPRYMNFKITRNIANGDFSLHSRREQYLPFMLDKILPLNERIGVEVSDETYRRHMVWLRQLDFANTPIAGNIWRYAYRYGFMGMLNRIFVNSDDAPEFTWNAGVSLLNNSHWVYANLFADNFIWHNIFNFQYYAPMLPTGASYQTSDDEAAANAAVDKA